MKGFRWLFVLLLVGGLALGSQAQSSTPGVSEDTIKLGSFIAQSGGVAFIGVPFFRGASAWYNWVNAHDGINGRQIEFIACDDGFDPAQTVACVQQLLEEDEVFAIVNPLGTAPLAAVIDTLVEQAVPVVSPGANATFLAEPFKPTVFALQPNNRDFGRFAARYPAERLGLTQIAAVYPDNAFGEETSQAFEEALAELGITPVRMIAHAPSETNFSNIVLQLQQAGAEAVALLEDSIQAAAAILTEADNLGFEAQFVGLNTITDPQLFELTTPEAAEGVVAPGFAEGRLLSDLPAVQLYTSVLQDPETGFPDEQPGGFSEIAYVGAQVVTEALAIASEGQELTRESFIAALESFNGWTNGLIPPLSYAPDNHSGITTLFVVEIENGTFVTKGVF